jgi:predicted HTH transcriptional regulator
MYVSGQRMTNSSLRERLGINQAKYTAASRIIRDAIDDDLLKPHSGGSESRRDASYVPFWA